jgi:hypothetical protein
MSLKNIKVANDAAPDEDRVGGQSLLDSGVYSAKVKMAYTRPSDKGAIGLTIVLDVEGKEIRSTMYITNKNGETYYEKDGKKSNLPGYNLANQLAMLTCGKALTALNEEERLVKVRNFTEKKDENIKLPVLVDMLGQEVNVGIVRQIVDKKAKGNDGEYHPTGETREENDISKFFCAKPKFLNMTAVELLASKENSDQKAEFIDKWKEANNGKVHDRSTKDVGKKGGPATGGNVAKPAGGVDTLFGDDD